MLLLIDSFIIRAVNIVSNLSAKNIQRTLVLQGVMTLILTVGLYFIRGAHEAVSAFLGGLVAILPAVSFAKLHFRHRGAGAARKIVNDFYLGEGVKIVVASLLFVFVFWYYRVSPIVFFLTYSVMVMGFGFLLLMFSRPSK